MIQITNKSQHLLKHDAADINYNENELVSVKDALNAIIAVLGEASGAGTSQEITLDNNAVTTLSADAPHIAMLQVGDDEERAYFSWNTSGIFNIISSSANVHTADEGTNLCLFTSTGLPTIKNRLGSTKTIKIVIF